jgi:hypothetical protein
VAGDFEARFAAAKGDEEEVGKARKDLHETVVAAFEKRLDMILTADQREAVKKATAEHRRREEEDKKRPKPNK